MTTHIKYPEEHKLNTIRRVTSRANKRPGAPWPECMVECPDRQTERDCRVQCWQKFTPTGQVGATRLKAAPAWTGYIGE